MGSLQPTSAFAWMLSDPLNVTWHHLHLLGFAWVHLVSFGLTWIHTGSFDSVTWLHLDSLEYLISLGSLERLFNYLGQINFGLLGNAWSLASDGVGFICDLF